MNTIQRLLMALSVMSVMGLYTMDGVGGGAGMGPGAGIGPRLMAGVGGGAGMGAAVGARVVSEPRLAHTNDERELLKACENGRMDAVGVLLDRRVDMNVVNESGNTPLHYACIRGHVDVVRELLDRGAQVNVRSGLDWTPLHWACMRGHMDVVRELVERGADMDAVNNWGETAADVVRDNGHSDVAALIAAEVAARTRRWTELRAGWCGAVVQAGWARQHQNKR